MKKTYHTLFIAFQILKVASLGLAALYFIFWFYRFFNFPLADTFALFLDILANPVKNAFPTTQIQDEHIAEYAYFIDGILLFVVVFVFAKLENFMIILDRRHNIKDIVKKQIIQDRVNKELKEEAVADIIRYKYFSIYIKFKIAYINEIAALSNAVNLAEVKARGYMNLISLIKQWMPNIGAVQKGDSAFITGLGFEDFDSKIIYILEAVKTIKIQNNNDSVKTDFLIIMDAQTDKKTCINSYNLLNSMGQFEYFNKALVTSTFKARFDLIQKNSKFMTDILGFSSLDNQESNDSEIFVLKSKPQKIT